MPKNNTRKSYSNDFKLQVVLETYQKENTIESVCNKHGLSATVVNKWRKTFKDNGHLAFASGSVSGSKKKAKTKESDSPEFLKQVIGDLTVENEILKKALSVWD
jgi:transposase